jgi:hypothetical protein
MVIHPQAPILTQPGAVLAAVKDAKRRAKGAVAKRPSLTAPARAALCVVRPGRRNGPFQPNKETTLATTQVDDGERRPGPLRAQHDR